MTMAVRAVAIALAGWLAWGALACSRRGEPVATLIETQGRVERSDAEAWTATRPGFVFVVGDALRTEAASQARLRLTNGTVIRVLENARVRFARGALSTARGADLKVELGSAEVEAATEEMALVTSLGVARVERGARVRVSSTGERSALEVLVGRAVLLGRGEELALAQGQGARIKPGDAKPERYDVVVGAPIVETAPAKPPEPPAPPPAPEPAAPPAPERAAAAEPSVDEKSSRGQNTRADVTLAAGDSGTLHVAGRSLALRLTFDRMCDGEASIEIKDGHARRTLTGSEALVLKLHPGAMKYSLRCAGDGRAAKPRATGSLAIKRDSGDAPVSRRAPVNVLDADGRRYTVLFQTRLPALTLKWGAAPAGADNLSLHIESPDGNKEMSSATSSKQLASGALGEGSYVWWYSTADGHTSPKTTVTIRFDNAAPTAQFFSKRSSTETAPKGLVAVDGVTIDGTKVSAGGHALAVDDHGRFRAEVAPLSGDDAVVVRLEHPRTGVHYYVRRLALRHHGRVAHAH
jgi:FecR protein